MKSPSEVVQTQLDAYNAKDIDALLDTYAPDAKQCSLYGEMLAIGHADMRPRFLARFAEPDLHAKLVQRTAVDRFVVDTEMITRNFPEGPGTIEMLCIYEVVGEKIVRASFALGEKRLQA